MVLLVAALVATAAPLLALAAEPREGTITTTQRELTWQGSTFVAGAGAVPNLLITGGLDPFCLPEEADPLGQVCDRFHFDVDVPRGWFARNGLALKVAIEWPDPGNKLLLVVYKDGEPVGYGWGSNPEVVVLLDPLGAYEVVVDPMLNTSPTSYTGTIGMIPLPKASGPPSLGGPAAFRAVRVADLDGARPPSNVKAAYSGPPLMLRAHPVGHGAGEPSMGFDPEGRAYWASMNAEQPTTMNTHSYIMVKDRKGAFTDISAGARDVQQSTNDPFVWVDPDLGRVFWMNMVQVNGQVISYSDDQGKTWTSTVASAGGGVDDHASLVTAVVPEGVSVPTLDPAFPKLVHYCSNAITRTACARSSDGGQTFQSVGTPLLENATGCASVTADHLSADREGRLYLGSGACGRPLVAVSEDAGATWTTHAVTDAIGVAGHDVATATDSARNVYAGWVDDQNSLPYVATSRDHGRTWSTPMLVAAPGDHEVSMLTLAAGDAGRLSVGYMGTTTDNLGDQTRPFTYRMSVSLDALAARPLFVSNVVTLPTGTKVLSKGGTGNLRDFLDQQLNPRTGRAWGTTGTSCIGACLKDRKTPGDLRDPLGYAVEQVSGPQLAAPRAPAQR